MENKEYLSEEKYQDSSKKLKKLGKTLLIIGVIVLVVGLLMIILGFTGFGKVATTSIENDSFDVGNTASTMFGSFGLFAIGGFVNFLGFGLTIAGGLIMFIAHRREITAYTAQQVMPVAKEGIEKMTPAFGTLAKGISKGIKEGINEANSEKEKKEE